MGGGGNCFGQMNLADVTKSEIDGKSALGYSGKLNAISTPLPR